MDDQSNVNDATQPAKAAGDKVKPATSDLKHVVGDAAADLKTIAKGQVSAAKEKVVTAVEGAQTTAVEQGRTAAATLRSTVDNLEGEIPWLGVALTRTADGLEQLTQAFETGDLNDAIDTVKGFARRQPALFIGLSVAAGFAIARIGKTALETTSGLEPSTPQPKAL